MLTKEEILYLLRDYKDYFSKYGVKRIGLFGSYSKGENTAESDVDILIDLDEESDITLFSLLSLEQSLEKDLNKNVDLVIKSNLKPHIGKNILSEVLYV